MRNNKFLKTIVTIIASITLFVPFVSADETYYTNMNGATLNKEQYDRLVKEFGYNTVATMSVSQIESVKDVTDFHTKTISKNIRTEYYYNRAGELIDSVSYEISDEEMEKGFTEGITTYSLLGNGVQKDYSDRVLTMTGRSTNPKIITITNTWKKIPSVKSVDVIALRPGGVNGTVAIFNINSGYSGYQLHDGELQNYPVGDDNYNIDESFNGSGGVGLSQNIYNSTTTSLENSLTVSFACAKYQFLVYGTYAHAIKYISLENSKKYSIHYSGFGSVILFNSSVKSYYESAEGLDFIYTPGDEIGL